ncbi:hypothetical protein N2152v2_005213 [Parachlorella kessleri]
MAEKENFQARAPVLGLKRKGFTAPAFVGKKAAAPSKGPPAPLQARAVGSASQAAGASSTDDQQEARYFQVLYTKHQPGKKLRKNKSFADGILEVKKVTKKATIYDPEGKVISSTALRGVTVEDLGNGSELLMSSYEVEIDSELAGDKFRSGQAFLKPGGQAVAALAAAGPATLSRGFKPVLAAGFKPVVGSKLAGAAAAGAAPAKAHFLHDPQAEGAVVLNRSQWDGGDGCDKNGRMVEGVSFMYESVMGHKESGLGCILADEMGLGKTLQILTLIWTLVKQGPQGRPAVRKALVVTPSTLTQNWADEARKWLGNERLRVIVLQPGADGKQQVVDFKHGQVFPLMVTSYETLRKHAADLAGCIDLLVCDEGHRLKSAQGNKTISALTSLNCPRRIILTGTPIQNNLQEFFAMADFVCPDVLGSLPTFERVFGGPISKSRDRNASTEEKNIGEKRSEELGKRVSQFVLRRTSDINAKYLPPLALYVAFCRPSPLQLRLYSAVLGSSSVRKMLTTTGADHGDQALTILTNLKKICNHPRLYNMDEETRLRLNMEAEPELDPEAAFDPLQSGKMAVLSVILEDCLGGAAGDRVVVVSQSTAALDLVQQLCDMRSYKTVRIDGSTDVTKRQDVVNSFNNYNVGQVFLLSTTAGGAGLNLVGANRLVLLDSHWNPAMDLQAMARIWRDGQKKPCVVYRLLTVGTIDEKMYQRQRMKGDIAAAMMDKGKPGATKAQGKGQFARDELKQLFTLRADTACNTYDILQGTAAAVDFKDVSGSLEDAPLARAVAVGHVSFVHYEKKELSSAAGDAGGAAAVSTSAGHNGCGSDGAGDGMKGSCQQRRGRGEGVEVQQQQQQREQIDDGASEEAGGGASQLEIEDDGSWAC